MMNEHTTIRFKFGKCDCILFNDFDGVYAVDSYWSNAPKVSNINCIIFSYHSQQEELQRELEEYADDVVIVGGKKQLKTPYPVLYVKTPEGHQCLVDAGRKRTIINYYMNSIL